VVEKFEQFVTSTMWSYEFQPSQIFW